VVSTTDPNGRILGFLDRGLDGIDVINTNKEKSFRDVPHTLQNHAKFSIR
jgi:hypothetical protein